MAARLVGEAFLNSLIGVLVDRLVSTVLVNLFQRKKLNRKSVEKLETTLNEARRLLNDAERKQIKDDEVKKWLSDLEDAVCVADDLMDGVSTIAEIQKLAGNSQSHNYLNLQEREIMGEMEGIIEKLELIVKRKDDLGLEASSKENMSWRVKTSLVKQSEIYGRDEDKEAVVRLLLGNTLHGELSMISIWGMGGIGKTTLAQLVYNDERVKGKFNLIAWVCVGENFDVFTVTRTITEAITSSSCNMTDLNLLQNNLKEKLTGKTFLIVLDDVWCESVDKWNTLLQPFHYGNEGSKILLTTRNENVSSVMPTARTRTYNLCSLSAEDCWLVFLKHSFLSTECGEYATLEPIGRGIVAKCKGLPLAVETLGSLLRTRRDVRDWDAILRSEIWEFPEDESKIIPELKISYHYLPSHLKRCFVYCSLYPKDYRFNKGELILLWMAEDFLPSKGRKTLEEIGIACFDELVARSFFQPYSQPYYIGGDWFVMHDLMHDLATFYGGKFYFRAEKLGNKTEIDSKTRHLSYNVRGNYSLSKLLTTCHDAKHIRTFFDMVLIEFGMEIGPFFIENAPHMVLSQLKSLRVLSFKSSPLGWSIGELPYSIGELIHLRYLDLSYACIVALPESLSNLFNLQTLKLYNCIRLKMLPSGMQNLLNLRHLDIRYTYLKEMPRGMSKLKHLHFLSDYIVGEHEENKIRELGALGNLHGSLSITNLQIVTNGHEALEARMIDKVHIDHLMLSWLRDSNVADSQTERGMLDILDKLRPHSNLKELSIYGYGGTIFPDWLGHSSYKNMTNLTLEGCGNCWKLPSLGQLPSLKHLYIADFHKLHCIDAEFYKSSESCSETPFQSLETLTFSGLRCWQEWRSLEFVNAFPQLKELRIDGCPVLIGALPDHLPALEKLTIGGIIGCEQLACSLPRAPVMFELSINSKTKLRMQELPLSLPSLSIQGNELVESALEAMTHTQPTCLRQLHISHCDSAFSFPGDCLPSSLQELEISDCKKLDFPMQQQQQHDSLRKLTIYQSCDSLTSFPVNAFPNLTDLNIQGCDSALSFPGDCLPSSLQDLRIMHCKKLDFPMQQQQQHHSLRRLTISESCDSLTSFPLNTFPNLTYLNIYRCENMKSLAVGSQLLDAAISSLEFLSIIQCPKFESFSTLWMAAPQLEFLKIGGCPEIDSFPEGGLPPNLRDLGIKGCDKLLSCLESMDLRSHGLTYLDIGIESESVKSFPKEGWLPTSLEFLRLWWSPSLETLDCNGLSHLTSLQSLDIRFCDKLENMTGERLPASLTFLAIDGCPLLGEHCRVKDPQIWSKISHIPGIHVEGEQIS